MFTTKLLSRLKRTDTAISSKCPKVSLILPVYNGSKFLVETLRSINSQDYPNLEIVICDDASSDDSLAKIYEFQKSLTHDLTLIKHPSNTGVSDALASCLMHADPLSKYLIFFAQDDLIPRDYVSRIVSTGQRTQAVVVQTRAFTIDEMGNPLKIQIVPPFLNFFGKMKTFFLLKQNYVVGTGALVRFDAYKIGMAKREVRYSQDWGQWVQLSMRGKISNCLTTNAIYRIHSKSLSRSANLNVQRFEASRMINAILNQFETREFLMSLNSIQKFLGLWMFGLNIFKQENGKSDSEIREVSVEAGALEPYFHGVTKSSPVTGKKKSGSSSLRCGPIQVVFANVISMLNVQIRLIGGTLVNDRSNDLVKTIGENR